MNSPEAIFDNTDVVGLHISQLEAAKQEIACEQNCAQILVDYPDEDVNSIGNFRIDKIAVESSIYARSDADIFALARHIFDRGVELELQGQDKKAIVETLAREIPEANEMPRLLRKTQWGARLVECLGRTTTKD